MSVNVNATGQAWPAGAFARWVSCALVATMTAACGNDGADTFLRAPDASAEAGPGPGETDAGVFDPTLGAACTDDGPCDDGLACTYDACDPSLGRCRNIPDDTLCDDGIFCNGKETCGLGLGCRAGPVETCQDGDVCTIDSCIEASRTCAHAPRDLDGDGDPDGHCPNGTDCDDLDPTISGKKREICGNFEDDNCNGALDEAPCTNAESDRCETAKSITTSGTYRVTTDAAQKDYVTSCSVATPSAAQDLVLAITAPGQAGGPPQDIELWARAESAADEVALALQSTCGAADSELSCAHIEGASSARTIARAVPAGQTIYAVVTTQQEGPVDVDVVLRDAQTPPANEACGAPTPVALEVPFAVSLGLANKDLSSVCADAKTGELTYAFTLDEPRDVRIFASTTRGEGAPMVTLRDADCQTELRCRTGTTPPLFARELPAGTHVFGVAATAPIDATFVVKTYPKTTPPPNQSCATAPPLVPNAAFAVDLSAQEDAIANGCLPGKPSAAYTLDLAVPSDVLIVGRFSQNEQGAISLNRPGCTTGELMACSVGTTPVRVSKRNVAAGSYRVVIADELGQSGNVTVFVRPTVAPTLVSGADACADVGVIPGAGGFFVGDTSGSTADFNAGCDSAFTPLNGARDQIFRFDITQPSRVVFDMTDSTYTTLLDLRSGATCPGTEVPSACYVGYTPSFLETTLAPDTYWVQVDGYAGSAGSYALDVRVLPP